MLRCASLRCSLHLPGDGKPCRLQYSAAVHWCRLTRTTLWRALLLLTPSIVVQ